MRADGWYLRSEIIWSKPNPMPESVTDRPTTAHSRVFLFAKSKAYYYDAEAIREPHARLRNASPAICNGRYGGQRQNGPSAGARRHGGHGSIRLTPRGRNRRSVWEIPTQPYPEAHFATWPEKLVEPMILAGTSERGICPECGAPWERVVERTAMVIDRSERTHSMGQTRSSGTMVEPPTATTTGWQPTCGHYLPYGTLGGQGPSPPPS